MKPDSRPDSRPDGDTSGTLRQRPELDAVPAYVPGKSSLASGREPIKLSSNESPYGPCAEAIAAFRENASMLHRYPDAAQSALRSAIAETFRLDPRRIVCGNGSEEIIGLVIRSFLGSGDELLLSEHHFSLCRIYGQAQGAAVVIAPETDFRTSVDALLKRLTDRTRVVAIANPNNPTGTYLSGREVRRLHAALPRDAVLILDNAYAEYVTADDYDTARDLAETSDNTVVTHTFSKIYGLAACRIGWAYCSSPVLAAVQTIRSPFNANAPAMAAAAAAVRNQAFIADIRACNDRERRRLTAAIADLGLTVIPSMANFYLLDFTHLPERTAREACAALETRGVIPRPIATGDHLDVLRITIGTPAENDAALSALTAYMNS